MQQGKAIVQVTSMSLLEIEAVAVAVVIPMTIISEHVPFDITGERKGSVSHLHVINLKHMQTPWSVLSDY